jgi:hypothetical protein
MDTPLSFFFFSFIFLTTNTTNDKQHEAERERLEANGACWWWCWLLEISWPTALLWLWTPCISSYCSPLRPGVPFLFTFFFLWAVFVRLRFCRGSKPD